MNKEKLIKDYIEDDILNIEQIIKDYSGYIYTIIENSSKNYFSKEDTEEIIADTFFILWKNIEKLETDKVLKFYLSGITKNLIKEKNRMTKNLLDIDDYIENLTNQDNIELMYEEREKIEYIERKLKNMKAKDIEIFQYFYYYDKTIKEISIIMNMSEFSIKSKLYRIRNKIKKELDKGGYRKNG